jgi:ABC-type branched-subunit amino acid transport system permease subunit
MMATVAGALWAFYLRYVNANVFFWENSGDAVIYSSIGGIESLFGPILGATGFRWLKKTFCDGPGDMNIFRVTLVMFLQDGIFSLFEGIYDRLLDRIRE